MPDLIDLKRGSKWLTRASCSMFPAAVIIILVGVLRPADQDRPLIVAKERGVGPAEGH